MLINFGTRGSRRREINIFFKLKFVRCIERSNYVAAQTFNNSPSSFSWACELFWGSAPSVPRSAPASAYCRDMTSGRTPPNVRFNTLAVFPVTHQQKLRRAPFEQVFQPKRIECTLHSKRHISRLSRRMLLRCGSKRRAATSFSCLYAKQTISLYSS